MWRSDSVGVYTVQEGAGQENQKSFLRRKFKMWIKACSCFLYIYHSLAMYNQEWKNYEDKEQVIKR